jgi:hypothetical protein
MKHFFVYNQEEKRGNNNVIVDDRNLREYYLVPFYETIVNAHGQSFMTSYNAVNGVPATCSPVIKSVVIGRVGIRRHDLHRRECHAGAYQSYKYFPSLEDCGRGRGQGWHRCHAVGERRGHAAGLHRRKAHQGRHGRRPRRQLPHALSSGRV